MKQSSVAIGAIYLTRVSGELVEVRVELVTTMFLRLNRRSVTRYRLRRVDNGTTLPKLRSAAALRPARKETT